MDQRSLLRPLRWFLLAWEVVTYLWGAIYLGIDPAALQRAYDGALWSCKQGLYGQGHCAVLGPIAARDLTAVGAFTGLMLLHAVLLWLVLSRASSRRIHMLSFLGQGVLACALSVLAARATNVALSLALILVLSASATVTGARRLSLVTCGTLALFVAGSLWVWGAWGDTASWIRFWVKSDYAVLVLFTAGYLLLYMQQVRLHGRLVAAHAALQRSATRIEDLTRQAERQRMARELHDILAQGLVGVIMQLRAADARLHTGRNERAREAIQQALADAQGALTEARGAIAQLRAPEGTTGDLLVAVEGEIARFTAGTGIACLGEVTALACLAETQHESLLRSLREVLTNVARHACARQVWVSAEQHGTAVVLTVRDDGAGFDPHGVVGQAGHYGLLGVRERMRLAGGQLTISSAPCSGTTIQLSVPCAPVQHARLGVAPLSGQETARR